MKVLFNHHLPFMLTHGGTQIQIEQTKSALEKIGVEVEFLRWWDDKQTGDLLQHFGRLPAHTLRLAKAKGMKVTLSELLTEAGSRSPLRLRFEKLIRGAAQHVFPANIRATLSWESYLLADACLVLTSWEAHLIKELFGAPANKVHVVPNGVEDIFFQSTTAPRGEWLVTTASITERKRVVELAEAAVIANVPVWIIGKPHSDSSPYVQKFLELVRNNPKTLRYEGAISDRRRLAQIYREARGFVLLSAIESLSLSALEAAACSCPLLLSDLPWARYSFATHASYCPVTNARRTADILAEFYKRAPQLPAPPRPLSWLEVAEQLKRIYESLLTTSR